MNNVYDSMEINIILLGESGVGKTSLLHRFESGRFRENLPKTFISKKKKVLTIENKDVNLVIWDTAGERLHYNTVKSYYNLADGVLLVYDVTNMETFLCLSKWLTDLKDINERVEIIIAGNKNENPKKKSVFVATVESFAQEQNIEYLEVSAKSGENVNCIFCHLTQKILTAKGVLPGAINHCLRPEMNSEETLSSPSAASSQLRSGTVIDGVQCSQQDRTHFIASENELLPVLGHISDESDELDDNENLHISECNSHSCRDPYASADAFSVYSAVSALNYFDDILSESEWEIPEEQEISAEGQNEEDSIRLYEERRNSRRGEKKKKMHDFMI